jgi:hypothetical protein
MRWLLAGSLYSVRNDARVSQGGSAALSELSLSELSLYEQKPRAMLI